MESYVKGYSSLCCVFKFLNSFSCSPICACRSSFYVQYTTWSNTTKHQLSIKHIIWSCMMSCNLFFQNSCTQHRHSLCIFNDPRKYMQVNLDTTIPLPKEHQTPLIKRPLCCQADKSFAPIDHSLHSYEIIIRMFRRLII